MLPKNPDIRYGSHGFGRVYPAREMDSGCLCTLRSYPRRLGTNGNGTAGQIGVLLIFVFLDLNYSVKILDASQGG